MHCAIIICSKLHKSEVICLPKHFGPLLRMLHVALDQSANTALESMELTASQGHILGFTVRQKTPPCPKDIEEAFHLSHPTVSGLLSRMEKKGFLELRTDENDRRCKRIHILPKGMECCHEIYHSILESETRLTAGFTPEELTKFRELLERAVTNLDGWPECVNCKEESKK